MDQSKRANWFLIIGAVIGILLAASGLLEDAKPNLNKQTLALVNDYSIEKSQYLGYLDLLAKEKRSPLTKDDQRHVLQRMIDEQLLLSRGIEIGLTESSPQVRKLIVQQVMQTVLSESEAAEVDDKELQNFYQENIQYFTIPARLQVSRLLFKNIANKEANQVRAQKAYSALLNGDNLIQVKHQYADGDLLSIPNEPLPQHKLLQYLGPTQTGVAQSLESGQISTPIQDGDNFAIVIVIKNIPPTERPFGEIKEQVSSEFERRRGDTALADYLEGLRTVAEVEIDEEFLDDLATATTAKAAP